MKKLFSSFKTPCTVTINLDPSESLDRYEREQLANISTNNNISANNNNSGSSEAPIDYKKLLSSVTRQKTIQRTIQVNDPHDQFIQEGNVTTIEVTNPSSSSSSNNGINNGGGDVMILQPPFMRFDKDDTIKGTVVVSPLSGGTTQHQGIRLELIGEIILYFESKQSHKFCNLAKELSTQGTIGRETSFPFEFRHVMKEYESYRGINCDLRYYLRVTITRSVFSIVKEQEFWVQHSQLVSPNKALTDPGISMEVGLEGIVLLSIKYDQMFHEIGHGCIHGLLRFYLVNVKIDKAEVSLIKKETTWHGDQELVQQETLKKFEIIDGTPAKDEVIPVRIYLSAIDAWKLTPTISDETPVEHKFSVKYFIYLALCDTKGRRFFKQREIILWRKHL